MQANWTSAEWNVIVSRARAVKECEAAAQRFSAAQPTPVNVNLQRYHERMQSMHEGVVLAYAMKAEA